MADLGLVHSGNAASEYSHPIKFFSRTYLTEGLRSLLQNAYQRLAGTGGDPIVELQTNFGGGKTHSLLALYHMASSTPLQDLPGLDQLFEGSSANDFPTNVSRAVIYGTARSALEPLEQKISRRPETGDQNSLGRPCFPAWRRRGIPIGRRA